MNETKYGKAENSVIFCFEQHFSWPDPRQISLLQISFRGSKFSRIRISNYTVEKKIVDLEQVPFLFVFYLRTSRWLLTSSPRYLFFPSLSLAPGLQGAEGEETLETRLDGCSISSTTSLRASSRARGLGLVWWEGVGERACSQAIQPHEQQSFFIPLIMVSLWKTNYHKSNSSHALHAAIHCLF